MVDGPLTSHFYARAALRLITMALFIGVAAIPAIVVTIEMVGSPVVIMFTNIIVPMSLVGVISMGGVYDKIVLRLEEACGMEPLGHDGQRSMSLASVRESAYGVN